MGPRRPSHLDLFTSADIHVTATIFDPDRPVIVSFSPAFPARESFGGKLFRQRTINHVAVTSVAAEWWQIGAVDAAGEAIRAFVKTFPRVVHYGSSMGAFGALFFSGVVQPDCVIVAAPQFAIQPDIPPYETRWSVSAKHIEKRGGFIPGGMTDRVSRTGKVFIVYDPRDPDAAHVRLFENIRPVEHVVVPFVGHGALFALAQMGVASRIATAALEKDPLVSELRQDIRAGRRKNVDYCHKVAVVLKDRGADPEGALHLSLQSLRSTDASLAIQLMNVAIGVGKEELAAKFFIRFIDGAIIDGDVGLIGRLLNKAPLIHNFGLVDEALRTLERWIGDDALPSIESVAKMNNTIRRYYASTGERGSRTKSIVRSLQWAGTLDTTILAMIAKAVLLNAANRKEEATDTLEDVSGLLSGWHPYNIEVAKVWANFGDRDRAIMYGRRVIERERGADGPTRQFLAKQFEDNGDYEVAAGDYGRVRHAALKGSPTWFSSSIGEARCLSRLGRSNEAHPLLKAVLGLMPTNALAQKMMLGIERNLTGGARPEKDGVIAKVAPGNISETANAKQIEDTGDFQQAAEAYSQARAAAQSGSPLWISCSIGYARCLRRLGKSAEGLHILEQVLMLTPDNALAQKLKHGIDVEMKRPVKATS